MLFGEIGVLQIKGSDGLVAYKHKALIRVLLHYIFITVERQKHIIALHRRQYTASEVHL